MEVRLRVAARTRDRHNAELVGNEVEALYTNGPAGGGGVVKSHPENCVGGVGPDSQHLGAAPCGIGLREEEWHIETV